jgi:L-fucose isomerase-like protein
MLMRMSIAKAAFVCFGEVNTPREIIEAKCRKARRWLEEAGLELVATEPVRDDAEGRDVRRAVQAFRGQELDLIVACVAGWIPSHAVLGVLDPFRHKPVLLLGLAGWVEGGRLLTTADQAGTSALRKPLEDLGYRFKYVYEVAGAGPRLTAVTAFARAARAASALREARVGMMGYRDMQLYGTLHDGVSLKAVLGVEIEFFEMLEMVQRAEKLEAAEVQEVVAGLSKRWKFLKPAEPETLEKGARYYLALRGKARERGWQGVSLIDVDGMKKLLNFPPAMVFMLLAEDPGVCVIPENDALGAVSQLVVRHLTGQAGAYLEFYEFMEDRVLAGVPDFVPPQVVEGEVKVLPSRFGLLGEGVLNVSRLKTGELTLCRLTHSGDRYALHAVTGRGVAPRRWEEAGWSQPAPQLPGLEVILDSPVEDFAQKVLSQHYILAYGNQLEALADFCRLTGIRML